MRSLLIVLCVFSRMLSVAQPDSLPPAPYTVKYKIFNPNADFVSCGLILTDSIGSTTVLAKCLVHDRKVPFYHWLNDSLILYEYCNNNNYERIRVMNVYRKSVVLEKRGYVQLYDDNQPSRNLDTVNRKLVFFTPQDQVERYIIKVLDLDSLKTTTLITLITSGDSFGVPYCKKINPKTRKVSIEYELPDHKGHRTVVVKY